jgi:subtilase family serine protease
VDGQVAELREDNNGASVTVLLRADLEVSGISFTSPPIAGRRTTAVARLANVGRAPSGVFNVKWFLDGAQVGYGSHASLAPGQVSGGNVRFDWTPTPGSHTLRFEADVDRQVVELREDNNRASVRVLLLADLQADGIELTSPLVAGRRTTARVRLVNGGRAPSGPFSVRWILNGVPVDTSRESSLAPHGQRRPQLAWTPRRGTNNLRFEADWDDRVRESDEANNDAMITVFVR